MLEQKLEAGLAALRPGFHADGADLKLTGWQDGVAEVALLFGPETCLECIASKEILTMIIEQALREQVPDVRQVRILDPREAG